MHMRVRAVPAIAVLIAAASLTACGSSPSSSGASLQTTVTPTSPVSTSYGWTADNPPASATVGGGSAAPTTRVSATPPADRAAALTQIRAAFTGAFGKPPSSGRYYGLGFVQNGLELRGAVDRVLKNFPNNGGTITVTLGAVTFTSPRSAAVEFTPHYSGGAPYGMHTGEAVLAAGRWVVTQET